MPAALSLHFALHLVPYLDPADIVCARRVCKDWHYIFSSSALAQVALRVHFPLCCEARSPSHPLDYSMFNRISKRYAALKSGIPRQELRIPIQSTRLAEFIWTFAENLLVCLSPHCIFDVLTLVYLDARTEPRRIINGKLVLGKWGTVRRVKVCRNILVLERGCYKSEGSPKFCTVECFRVSLSPGNSEVIATKVSSFDTFGLNDSNHWRWPISDHSGKYYAVYSGARAPDGDVLQIWDIEMGKMVRHIPAQEFPNITNVTNVLVVARKGHDGPQQVVVTGNDWVKDYNYCRHHVTPVWDYVTNFKVFPITPESHEWTGRVAHKEQQGRSSPIPPETPLATSFKVPRRPAGIASSDDPGVPGYLSEEMGFTIWHWNSGAGDVHSSYHSIIPDHPPASEPGAPLAVEREFRMSSKGIPFFSPFHVGFCSGLSLTMDASGEIEYIEGRELMSYQLRIRGFNPSTTPDVMDFDWETCLKSSKDRRKTWKIFSPRKRRSTLSQIPLMVVDESDLATAFLDFSSGESELVLVLWD